MDNYQGGIHKRKSARAKGPDKSPYNRRDEEDTKKAFKAVEKSVAPVAKDTNKTRRKETMKRKESPITLKTVKPKSNLKKDMKKPMMNKRAASLNCRKM
jgi:hypothetical protein